MGGILSRPRSQKIFACCGPKNVFLMFLMLKNFRLRRAKNHVLCVVSPKIFSPAAGTHSNLVFKNVFTSVGMRLCHSQNDLAAARTQFQVFHECRNALLLFAKQSGRWQPHRRRSWVFTSVGTRFYYSQNNLAAAQTQFLAFSRVQERASTIHKKYLEAAMYV